MDNNYWIERIIKMHFEGYETNEAIEIVKAEKKEQELKSIVKTWEDKALKAPVADSGGWKYQQPKLI